MNRRNHWDHVFATKGERDVSWFEALPRISIEMLEATGITPDTCVLDVGGGDSRLIDHLVARGLDCLAVLDVSGAALRRARGRLGATEAIPVWIEADVTGDWTLKPMDVWHDRAVFHFLTDAEDRSRYLGHLREVLRIDGTAIIATFALDGPERCSGLQVARYSPESLAAVLGPAFSLVEARRHEHITPWGSTQAFQYSRLVRVA
jgi:SAM-dependent methyltransferase